MPVNPSPATPLPIPPSTTSPANFDIRADEFLGALPNYQAELYNIATAAYDNAVESANSASNAATIASNAASSAAAASESASAAASSANAAAASAGGQLWVSGTTYAVGALVFSALTGRNYRRIIAGAGTTDPSADSTNWRAVLLDVDTRMPTVRPTLLLDFANGRTVDSRISVTRASTATRINERGVLESVAAGVPRIDFDPVTLACKGWLIEEQRTNRITNNAMQGAVVGSPGTMPAGWSVSGTGSGITRTVVSTGEENGIGYIDIRFDGTPTINSVGIGFADINAIAAASGQAWALSAYLRLVGGSFANTSPVLDILETDGTNGVGANQAACVATSAPLATQRFVYAATLSSAGTTHVQPRIRIGLTNGEPVDFTLRVGLPQFEAGGFATSVIRTTGAAATRAADVPVMTGSNFSSWYRQDEGTFLCDYSRNSDKANGNQISFMASDGTGNNIIAITDAANGTSDRVIVIFNGANQTNLGSASYAANQRLVRAFGYKQDSLAASINGSATVEDTSALVPVVNQLSIGHAPYFSSSRVNGHIRRIAYYPKRLSNAELQALTTP